jgi:hypothetical protein
VVGMDIGNSLGEKGATNKGPSGLRPFSSPEIGHSSALAETWQIRGWLWEAVLGGVGRTWGKLVNNDHQSQLWGQNIHAVHVCRGGARFVWQV